MHIPTPSLRRASRDSQEQKEKSQKRKASDTSTDSVDDRPARKRLTEAQTLPESSTNAPKRTISLRKPKRRASTSALAPDDNARLSTGEQRASLEPDESEKHKRSDSIEESQEHTPRRSSRIKESMGKVSEAWDKCRPYIERLNGTLVPLDNKTGTEAYYHRDGMKT